MPTLALIHTVASLVPVFDRLTSELLPDVDTFNIVDESLLRTTVREGRLTPTTARRLAAYVASAEAAGADAVLVTCSSVGAAVEATRPFASVPLLRIDEAMVDEAVAIARRGDGRIGVLATLRSTLEPTADLVRRRAAEPASDGVTPDIRVTARVCEGAFDALKRGDGATHDRLVVECLAAVAADADVVLLAQASMARVVDALPPGSVPVPVLSSPRLAVERAAETMRGLGESGPGDEARLPASAAMEAGS
ncbi:MAG TPA: aspartate/glutamate racemase family protein [Candidatus Limnocylindrales bacterium]|nr:aspartate/glutamate racemase family protein [Candidatus Limnocylindrales bacterium]